MYLRIKPFNGSEGCSKCGKPMDADDNPAVLMEYTDENGKQEIWAHIECIQQLLFKARKNHALRIAGRTA